MESNRPSSPSPLAGHRLCRSKRRHEGDFRVTYYRRHYCPEICLRLCDIAHPGLAEIAGSLPSDGKHWEELEVRDWKWPY
jgi:hypothetical protein